MINYLLISCQAEAGNPSGDKFCRAANYPFEDQEEAGNCRVGF